MLPSAQRIISESEKYDSSDHFQIKINFPEGSYYRPPVPLPSAAGMTEIPGNVLEINTAINIVNDTVTVLGKILHDIIDAIAVLLRKEEDSIGISISELYG